jgi:hypothetical protein
MSNNQELRKIERKAKALMLNKDIPKGKMDAVRSLINNSNIDNRERYTTIIDIIKDCPDKPVPKIAAKEPPATRAKPSQLKIDPIKDEAVNYLPTETSYYIDDLNRKYKYLRIFKKRYLAHRNNRFGIGFRKRLIPAQKLLKILKCISESQEKIIQRLSPLLTDILNDENIDNPVHFNYLRAFRKWMMDTPLASYNFDSIKWMERNNFEREFKNYIINFYSFLKMETGKHEELIELIEIKLRESDDLLKEEIAQFDTDPIRRGKEKRNLEKEKGIHEYISLLRSFLISRLNDESLISVRLKKQYGIENLSDLLLMINETLIFQRPVTLNELHRYFEISAPVVSAEKWDYNEETLKKIGKDPSSRKRREIKKLELRLDPYNEIVEFLKAEREGKTHIIHGVEKQWELIDKKRQRAENAYHDDFFLFIDGVIQYFRNSYLQLLDGSSLYLRDPERNEIETSFFSKTFLIDELSELDSILDEMHLFKSNNPTLTLKYSEIKKIMMKQLTSLSNVEDYIRNIGNFFYRLAKKMQEPYDMHRKWIFNGSPPVNIEKIRHPLERKDINRISKDKGAPLPYYDCTIKEFYQNNQLVKSLAGKKFIDESGDSGIYPDILSFLYQTAHECYNDYLLSELDERKRLMRQIEEISR